MLFTHLKWFNGVYCFYVMSKNMFFSIQIESDKCVFNILWSFDIHFVRFVVLFLFNLDSETLQMVYYIVLVCLVGLRLFSFWFTFCIEYWFRLGLCVCRCNPVRVFGCILSVFQDSLTRILIVVYALA